MTNTDTKKYRLLKDLPDGAIKGDVYKKVGDRYFNQRLDALKSPVIEHNSYFSWQVEDSLEWFEEVLPESIPNKQDEKVDVKIYPIEQFKMVDGYYKQGIYISKRMVEDQCEKIKQAIEAAINQPSTTPIEDKGNVLFTTDDGVKFDNNYNGPMWRVFTRNTSYPMWEPIELGIPIYKVDGEKYFSTKEAAEEFIFLNKPQFSINDVSKEYVGDKPFDTISKLYKIAKQKLNQ